MKEIFTHKIEEAECNSFIESLYKYIKLNQ